jgi:hypothetical protein
MARTPWGDDLGDRRGESVHLFTLCQAISCYNVLAVSPALGDEVDRFLHENSHD